MSNSKKTKDSAARRHQNRDANGHFVSTKANDVEGKKGVNCYKGAKPTYAPVEKSHGVDDPVVEGIAGLLDSFVKRADVFLNSPVYSRSQMADMLAKRTVDTRKAVHGALESRMSARFFYGFMAGAAVGALACAGCFLAKAYIGTGLLGC